MRCSVAILRPVRPWIVGLSLIAIALQPLPTLGFSEGSATIPAHPSPMVSQSANQILSAQLVHTPPVQPMDDPDGKLIHWAHTLAFYFGIVATIAVLSFTEWRWMISRQCHLRALVLDRTRELEAEKAELLRAKADLVRFASTDALTGIFNRAIILELLEEEMSRASRERASFAVILADLDYFKRINDAYGHLAGDVVLREFARRIQTNIRPGDQVGRYGGEELLIFLRGMPDGVGRRIAELHRKTSESPFLIEGQAIQVTSSFGAAWYPAPVDSVDDLLNLADQALYLAKAKGRDRIEILEWPSLPPKPATRSPGLPMGL